MRNRWAAVTGAWLALAAADADAVTQATWLGPNNGLWVNAAQWSSNPLYPCNGNGGETFDVSISSTGPALNVPCSIETLSLSGPSFISGTGSLTVNQSFSWSGGGLIGSGTLLANGGASLSGPAEKLVARTLVLAGPSQWSDGEILLQSNATLRNTSSFLITGPTGRQVGGLSSSGKFDNQGTLTVALDSPASQVTLRFLANSGAIVLNTGKLVARSSGTLGGSIEGGNLRLEGTYTLGAGATLDVSSLELAGSLSLPPGAQFEVGNMEMVNGSSLMVDTPVNVGGMTLRGSISGSALLQVDGLVWNDGSMSGSGTTRAASGVEISGDAVSLAGTRTLALAGGTSSWTQADIELGFAGATLRNEAASTWIISGDDRSLLDENDTGSLVNEGTLWIDLDTPTRVLTLSPGMLTQNGVVHLTQGVVKLSVVDATYAGSLDGAGTLQLETGTHHLAAGSSLTVAQVEVKQPSHVVVDAGAVIDVPNLSLEGSLGGAGDVEISGPFVWTTGVQDGSGITRALAGATLSGPDSKILGGTRELILVGGNSSWSDGAFDLGSDGATLRNGAASALAVTGPSRFLFDGLALGQVVNEGTLTLDLDAANQTLLVFPRIENNGSVELAEGTLQLLLPTAVYTQTAGITRLTGGTLRAEAPLDLQGGRLEGNGVIDTDVESAAEIAPGTSAGTLTLTGDLTSLPGATLHVELGGTAQGSQYDFVSVGGNAALAGSLTASFLSGFENAITPGNSFTVLDAAAPLSGSFTNVASGQRVLVAPGYDSLAVSYGAGSAFGSDRVVLHDFQPFVANDTSQVSGTAEGGTITLSIDGVEIVVNTTPGMTAAEVAEAIAAAIRAHPQLSGQGIAGVANGPLVDTNGDFQGAPVVTDPGLLVGPVTTVPALPLAGVALLAAALAAVGRRRAQTRS